MTPDPFSSRELGGVWARDRGGSASIRNLYSYVTSSGDIRYDNRSYAVVAQRKSVSEGRFRHHLFQAVFVRTTYPSRYVYFRWSKVHTAVETAVTATVVM